jgi:HEAT repeat protein
MIERLGAMAVKDADKHVRFQAAQALLRIGRPALNEIVSCLKSEDARVREVAAYVPRYSFVPPEKLAPLLVALLKEKAAPVRQSAAWSLSQMGEDAHTVLGELRAHAGDPDAEVRRLVRATIAAIEARKN